MEGNSWKAVVGRSGLLILYYAFGILGGLVAAVLIGVLAGLAAGAGETGARIALWVILLAWAGFAFLFCRHRDFKRTAESMCLTIALAAFALPISGFAFTFLLWAQYFDPVGDQTQVMGNAAGLLLGGGGMLLGLLLLGAVLGGLGFLLFLLLKSNLAHVGRALTLEAQRWLAGEPSDG
ncbi:MAG: hypothetical protein HY574_11725 [candidate division NC10 bacterium]|nr:hypothetical protein [candidate division NC10 bacterium]